MTKTPDEVAGWFDTVNAVGRANFGSEVYPGYPGAVLADGPLTTMSWGFPLRLKGAKGQPLKPKPVNNVRTDKLKAFFWRDSFENRRCLIPLTAWAEAEGARGAKTRSWLKVPGKELFAAAGVWRKSDEWGDVYSMIMTDAAGEASKVHHRMPVLLRANDFAQWREGTSAEAFDLCVPWSGALKLDRTEQPWSSGRATEKPV